MKIAVTGGIGCGKSYVCQLLKNRGIDVFDCDEAAKRLMRTDRGLQADLKRLVGEGVYKGPKLQKSVLAKFLLGSEDHKQKVNDVVHPAVARDFLNSGLEWLESAILFESGFDRRISLDYVVCVSAPVDVRLERIITRDHISLDRAMEWIESQMPQEEVESRCNYIVVNDGQANLDSQIEGLLQSVEQARKALSVDSQPSESLGQEL
jgi:dephospho-CoA kinase